MKSSVFVFFLSLVMAVSASAESMTLKCIDVKSQSARHPLTMTINLVGKNMIKSVSFDYSSSSVYQYLPKDLGSRGNQYYYGSDINNNRSPYKGNEEYSLLPNSLRLILTSNKSEQGLINADVDGRGEGHAAVVEVAQQLHRMWSGGSLYIRFTCKNQK